MDQFKSIVIIILVAAALFAFITARYPEAIALLAVTLVNTAIGFFTELKAIRSMEALRKLGEYRTGVLRDGGMHKIAAEELVPGDIVELSDGELVPADIRLVAGEGLRVNEAALTGESTSVNKSAEQVDSSCSLHERSSMLYKGTTIAEGIASGVVTATAMETEIGRVARLTAEAEETISPLQKRLDGLGRRLAWVTLGVAVLVGIAGLAAGRKTVIPEPMTIQETTSRFRFFTNSDIGAIESISKGRGFLPVYNGGSNGQMYDELLASCSIPVAQVLFVQAEGQLPERINRPGGSYRKRGSFSMAPVDKDCIDACVCSTADIVEGVTGEHGTAFICTKQGHDF